MSYTKVPTYTTNQLITASHANTYWRDNINALWPFTNAGDIAFARDADDLARLAISTAGSMLKVNAGATAPEWLGLGTAGSILKADATSPAWLGIGSAGQVLRVNSAGTSLPVYGSPLSCYGTFTLTTPTSTSATNWADITDATVDIVVPCTSTLIAMATLQGSEGGDSADEGFWRWMIDSEGQPETGLGYQATVRFPVSVIALKASVAAGTKTCKLQRKTTAGGQVGNRNILGIVLGFAK